MAEQINWKLEEILLHLGLKIPKEKEIKDFLECLSPENLPSIGEISREGKNVYVLSISGEKAFLHLNISSKLVHLITSAVAPTTLEKSNSSLNEFFALLRKSIGIDKVTVNGLIRIEFRVNIPTMNITSKLVSESNIQDISSKIGEKLCAKGIRCMVNDETDVIFDVDSKSMLSITIIEKYDEYFEDLLKTKFEKIQTHIKRLVGKLKEV